MGIDAQAYSRALPKGLVLRLSGRRALETIARGASDWASAQGLGPLFQTQITDDGNLEISLVPVADPVIFTAEHDRITADFRSSNGGPGFHAAVVEMMEHLDRKLDLGWRWTDSEGYDLDETGYARHKDFAALQGSMADFLRGLSWSVANMPGAGNALCLPLGLGLTGETYNGPLGPQSPAWCAQIPDLSAADLRDRAAEFFIWWDRGLTPATWEGLLRAQLWMNAPWRPACNAADPLTEQQIDHTVARLVALGHPLPADLAEACAEYAALRKATDQVPAPRGIGYRKRLVCHFLTASWTLSLPGYLAPKTDENGSGWEHPAFWLGLKIYELPLDSTAGTDISWPASFTSATREIRPGIFSRKSSRDTHAEGSTQMAVVISQRPGMRHLMLLTLSSHLDWPFDEFDDWIGSITCPDLQPKPAPSALH
ncbi:hypothetical protein [Tabrizicola fusiformis]|uniref:hypothetical protein n=1 Tax=Tabrizicola sp. SY72 TaxID=2741673 RepID=UPI001573495D|nr:hypothetical protein [Tabrizicola sp. SY72]NTT84676.1 hypothetical protein [Tabrizicola sp. SY72]